MKTLLSYARLSLTLGAISCFSILSPAAAPAASGDTTAAKTDEVTVAQSATDAPSVAANATVKLPYGVDDVLKLSRAKVNEDIIQSYIQNSGTIYNLGPNDIVYLRDQGVSDRVLNAMLDQRKKALEIAAQTTAPAPAAEQTYQEAVTAPLTPPAPTYVQPAPSSVYVIPYASGGYGYYGGYRTYYGYYRPYCYSAPYYRGYFPFPRPFVSFGFGFGGHGHFSHHHR